MARDIGIPGTGPSSVTASDLSEEETAVVRYVKQADLDIQNKNEFINLIKEKIWKK